MPNDIALPPPDCIWRMKKIHTPTSRISGNQEMKMENQENFSSSGRAETTIFLSSSDLEISASAGL